MAELKSDEGTSAERASATVQIPPVPADALIIVPVRNMVLFPEKINGLYARLDRPFESGRSGNIWISFSPDLVHWGQSECIMQSRAFAWLARTLLAPHFEEMAS